MKEKSFNQLREFLTPSPFRGGEVIYLSGFFSYTFTYHLLSKELVDNEKEAIMVDAAKSIDPYDVMEEAKERNDFRLLDRIEICRGFTAYQLFDILHKKTKEKINNKTRFLMLFDPSNLLLDDEVGIEESYQLFISLLEETENQIHKEMSLLLVDNCSRFSDLLNNFSDQSIFFEKRRDGIRVLWGRRCFYFDPLLSLCQTTLKEFINKKGCVNESIRFKNQQKKIKDFMEA